MAKRRLLPSQTYLQECFDYDPETGILRWKTRPLSHFTDGDVYSAERLHANRNGRCAGKIAGCVVELSTGYKSCRVSLDGKGQIIARIVYKMIYGVDPVEVDHGDLDSTNNKLLNLRESNINGNRQNRKLFNGSSTGYKGITKTPYGKYQARISKLGKCISLGNFDTPEEAHAAYCEASSRLHGKFSRTN